MLAGISVICFTASYALALALEISRFYFRSGIRSAAMIFWASAGLLANTIYLYYHGISPEGYPITSQRELFFVAAWILAAIYLYLTVQHPRTAFGLYILPVILGLIGVGYFWAEDTPFSLREARGSWAYIHGLSFFVVTVTLAVGFVTGLMYLIQAYRLKHKLPPYRLLRLPTLEWLEKCNYRALLLGTIMLALGVISGIMLNRGIVLHDGQAVPMTDPLVFGTSCMFLVLVVMLIASTWYRPIREGHRVAYQTVISFVFLMLILMISLMAQTRHWQIDHNQPQQPNTAQPGDTPSGETTLSPMQPKLPSECNREATA